MLGNNIKTAYACGNKLTFCLEQYLQRCENCSQHSHHVHEDVLSSASHISPLGTFCFTLPILCSAPARRGLSGSVSLVHACAAEAQTFIHPLALVWPEESCCGRVSLCCWVADYSCGRLQASIVLYASIPDGYW